MPSLVDFMESLTQEKEKLVTMETIKPSKDQALVVGDSKMDSKGRRILIQISLLIKINSSPSLMRSLQSPRRIPKKKQVKVR